ncbi:MAG: hypothetical protein NWE89_01660, partial [Candidatus Bathyarchaeota archaeon]|nr:hypothetical protein [Candidatus Bathyarchaeota archaeon]
MNEIYGNLFNMEITFFGVFIAAVFVFYELVYSKYPLNKFKFLLYNVDLILFSSFIIFSMVTSLLAYFTLSYNVDIVPAYNLNIRKLFSGPHYGILCIFLFCVSIMFFITFVINNIGFLNPRKMVVMLSQNVEKNDIKLFLYKKYGLTSPEEKKRMSTYFPLLASEEVEYTEQQYKIDTLEFQKLLKTTEVVEDPFLMINDMATKAIINYELGSFYEVMLSYE